MPQNKFAIAHCLSYLFTHMQKDTLKIEGINLYFPDYNFRQVRAMTQFIISVILIILAILYNKYMPFPTLVASNTESVLLIVIFVALEIGILLLTVFQNMCNEDSFTMIERHPLMIFLLPIIVIFISPLLHKLIKTKGFRKKFILR